MKAKVSMAVELYKKLRSKEEKVEKLSDELSRWVCSLNKEEFDEYMERTTKLDLIDSYGNDLQVFLNKK